jgi:hypothetical protein
VGGGARVSGDGRVAPSGPRAREELGRGWAGRWLG